MSLSQNDVHFEKLSADYSAIISVLNQTGTELVWLALQDRLKEIHDEGLKYGCSFSQNPCVRIKCVPRSDNCPLCGGSGRHPYAAEVSE